MFLGVAFCRELSGLFVVVPLGAFSIGLTKWGLKWQNDRYLRSAKNVDDIQELSKKIDEIAEVLRMELGVEFYFDKENKLFK